MGKDEKAILFADRINPAHDGDLPDLVECLAESVANWRR